MNLKKGLHWGQYALLGAMLCAYFAAIILCNFCLSPFCFETDMYADMNYATYAWAQKTVFPEGWAYSNQVYVVATPVLAALFYGITGDPSLAMSIASTIMGILVLVSLWWMLKPITRKPLERLFAVVAMLAVTMAVADPVWIWTGWQLLFTMCSYYSCYLITAFLAMGCYLRWEREWARKDWAMLVLAGFLSFATGIQSLRETAMLTCPLIAVEFLHCLYRRFTRQKVLTRATTVTGVVTVTNLLGVLYEKTLDLPKTELFGKIELVSLSEIWGNAKEGLENLLSIFYSDFNNGASATLESLSVLVWICLAAGVVVLGVLLVRFVREGNTTGVLFLLFFLISPLVILAMDVLTTMSVRRIYYVMMFPLAVILLTLLYSKFGKPGRILALGVLVALFTFNATNRTANVPRGPDESHSYADVVQCLEENEIHTVYAVLNLGEKFGITSDWEVKVGFWGDPSSPFSPMRYLCYRDIFDEDPAHCAYAFRPEELEAAQAKIDQWGVDWELLEYCPDSDIYLYVSDVNLMLY